MPVSETGETTELYKRPLDIVYTHVKFRLDRDDVHPHFSPKDVFLVWFSKTLENWKALVATTLPEPLYYEVTYNGQKDETYVDTYIKMENTVYHGGGT